MKTKRFNSQISVINYRDEDAGFNNSNLLQNRKEPRKGNPQLGYIWCR